MNSPFEYIFPAIRGIQAQREYFVSMCPLPLIPKIFLFDEDELVPELRAQRTLNKGRVPELARYILDNPRDYAFSAITASVDGDMRFEPMTEDPDERQRVGLLHVPMSARFIINDGQHRRAAVEMALRENPDLIHESIAVVFFQDRGLERCQQLFADLNRHAIRPSKSIGILYDHRDDRSEITRQVVQRSPLFREVVEMERSTLSSGSRKLFTLSALHSATRAFLQGFEDLSSEARAEQATEFWGEVTKHFNDWELVRQRKLTAGEVRRDFIHSHGVVLQAIGRGGSALIKRYSKSWPKKLAALGRMDWSRINPFWEGRAMIGGRVSKSSQNVSLTCNAIKQQLGLELTAEEARLEEAHLRGGGKKAHV
jgi:DNA sulfur modification protein DndB